MSDVEKLQQEVEALKKRVDDLEQRIKDLKHELKRELGIVEPAPRPEHKVIGCTFSGSR